MKNIFDDKMADIMIGEAVTALLDEDVTISWAALTDRLRANIRGETDEERVRAGQRAIEEVGREMKIREQQNNVVAVHRGLQPDKLH
ncbi:hypothetical protein PRCB_17775 [Pantoea rodasii]|uniref:Uncharacterized protein n=1 Tax=Pantoea rodasii TaxID=1076549 RepID=A0A2M9W9C8_9GAMM|nr:hypothetical protein [Pantoea rodasii]PJZ04125.1 hypothetical protein PRCB_17775 [Pantoea rodasii]